MTYQGKGPGGRPRRNEDYQDVMGVKPLDRTNGRIIPIKGSGTFRLDDKYSDSTDHLVDRVVGHGSIRGRSL